MRRLYGWIARGLSRLVEIDDLRRRLDELENLVPRDWMDDDLYTAIEDRFRGSPELIRSRQQQYVDLVVGVTESSPLLDLGSGRGEWLDLMRSHGVPASGVDSNEKFVAQCRAHGLHVVHDDLVRRIRGAAECSLGAVTMFQVAEHLPLAVLVDVLQSAHRALVPGGVLVVEIPNLETLRVGASTFWIDPTHVRPLFPGLLALLTERAGFRSVRIQESTPLEPAPAISDPVLLGIHARINGNGDCAVIGLK